jgi:hypothetical protein
LLQNNEKYAQQEGAMDEKAHARLELSATEKKALDLEILDRFLASDASMSFETRSPTKAPLSFPQPSFPPTQGPINTATLGPTPLMSAVLPETPAPVPGGSRPPAPRPTRPRPPVSPPNNVVVLPPVPNIGGRPATPVRPPRQMSPPNNVVIPPPVPQLAPRSNNRGKRMKNRSNDALPVAP